MHVTRSLLVSACLLLVVGFAAAQPAPGTWDLKDTGQAGLFVFYDMPAGASTTGKPLDVGDFDGNGCGDIAITGQNAAHALVDGWRGSAGHVRVLMNVCDISGHIAIEEAEPETNFFTIFGAYSGDMAGTETYIDDFNGDGYDDLLFSAQNSDGPQQNRSNAGAAYVLFGAADFAEHADVDLRQSYPDILSVYGAAAEDRFGLWVEGGDFDGDGFQDLLIGANQADGIENQRANAGEVWIIYGAADMLAEYGPLIDIAEAPADATRIIGADYDDLMGSCVWGDDLNGDGIDDAVVSAGLWRASSGVGGLSFGGADGPGNQRYNSGETFVIFGMPTLRGQVIDLAATIDENGAPLDDSVSVIYGADANDLLGEEIATGDMDGDGRLDLIVGTLVGDGADNTLDEAGEAWIIYTHDPFEGQVFDLASIDPARAVVIYPDQADSKAGDTLRAADLDGDGIDDLFYGAPDYDPTGLDGRLRHNAGMMPVIFGERGGLPNDDGRILVADPPDGLRIRMIIGGDDNDMMPYALAIGDVNGDGVIDIAPNAMGGDGFQNTQINAGEIYVIDGAEFLSPEHVYRALEADAAQQPAPAQQPTPLPDATVAPSGAGDPEQGRIYYEETCAGCHGYNGEGVPGLGLPLVTSPLVMYAPDLELLLFLRVGRPADDPDNVLGVSMPPSGGRPDWGNAEFTDIIAYLRWLRTQSDSEG
ncbi:MAG: FG-GAP repeat protein [Anaerolineae bacterium]|nr:FG-GAP repeat protein [Anaerolineae bacterium]